MDQVIKWPHKKIKLLKVITIIVIPQPIGACFILFTTYYVPDLLLIFFLLSPPDRKYTEVKNILNTFL